MRILGLESSCDDCSASVVEETPQGPRMLSLVRQSQDHIHGLFGGVVPEIAAREHLLQIRGVLHQALDQARCGLQDLDRVAVTQGPGLVGSLLVGFSAVKALAWREGLKWVGVHHLLGHLNAARFAHPQLPFPALALLVSGGHSHLFLAENWTKLTLLQKTRDDAAGELFDKAARMLQLGYPGGPPVDACARKALEDAPPFKTPKFRDGIASYSFSGLKTAVKLRIEADTDLQQGGPDHPKVQALCSRLQKTTAEWLLKPVPSLAEIHGVHSLIISGGVACNSELRAQGKAMAARLGLELAIPEPRLCTDNGAMIAAAGALLHPCEAFLDQNVDADLRLDESTRSC